MERYWCLRWLTQAQAQRVDAVVLKEEVLRLVEIPLIIKLPGMPVAPRGASVKLDLVRWDEVDLSVEARLHEIVAAPVVAIDDEVDEELDEVLTEELSDGLTEQSSSPDSENSPSANVEITTTDADSHTTSVSK
jgi:exoribonuclease-2